MRKILKLLVFALMLQGCGYVESDDRDECSPSFKRLVGFTPPSSIVEIRHAYFVFRDGVVNWMEFTYDKGVMKMLVKNDMALKIATRDTWEHDMIMEVFEKENPNAPSWFIRPNRNDSPIYYKKDFMEHSFSEYYMWIDYEAKKVTLMVHFFD